MDAAGVESFGFTVRRCYDYDKSVIPYAEILTNRWDVHLPHMCEDWIITEGYDGEVYDGAVKSLEAFIAEAQAALVALKNREEFGNE